MAGTGIGCEFGECLGELESVACEVVGGAVDTLLEHSAGIQGSFDGVGVAAERAFALHFEVGREAAQAVHLVAHFAGSCFGGATQAGVHGAHVIEEGLKFRVERISGGSELLLAFDGHGAGCEELGEGVGGLAEDAIDAEVVFVEELCDGGFDERGGKTRFGGGGSAEDALVEDGGLGEVGDLGGAANDERGSEEIVLEDGAEEGGWGDAVRFGGEDAKEVGGGEALAASLPEVLRLGGVGGDALEGEARAGAFVEEEDKA